MLIMKALNNVGSNPCSHYTMAPLVKTWAHTNWPRQEGYVPTSELRTQARIGKNNLKMQMNDYLMNVGVLQTECRQNCS
jgi:hypothetical protein